MLQLDRKTLFRWPIAGAVALVLAACQPIAPTSDNPIESAGVGDAEDLLGAWYGELNGYEAYVHVVAAGPDGELKTVIVGNRSAGGGWGSARAIPASLEGTGYLSIEIDEEHGDIDEPLERGFHLLRYRTGRGYVTLYAMDETMVDEAIANEEIEGDVKRMRLHASSNELVDFIQRSGGPDLFSVQIGYLERVDEDQLPASEYFE